MPEQTVIAPAELSQLLSSAIRDVEERIVQRLDATRTQIQDPGCQLDALERAIDEVADIATRQELRRQLAQLDEIRVHANQAVQDLRFTDCFDPLRAIATDLALNLL